MTAPLAIDLFCGLGGWTEGLLDEGYRVVGFDVERHVYGEACYPAQLVLQDVLTIHGAQFRDAALIVASPPCQAYSYRAMPWKRARALPPPDNSLFEACFRIQREACEAADRYIPLVVENVCGAQKWVGRARWHFGSFYLWGDVPALMPITRRAAKRPGHDWNRYKATGEVSPHWRLDGQDSRATKNTGGSWFNVAHNTTSGHGQNPTKRRTERNYPRDGAKTRGHLNIRDGEPHTRHLTNPSEHGVKQHGSGATWFDNGIYRESSKSNARKAASACIAKIPLDLSRWIAKCYYPQVEFSNEENHCHEGNEVREIVNSQGSRDGDGVSSEV